jgi:hypothetical protein
MGVMYWWPETFIYIALAAIGIYILYYIPSQKLNEVDQWIEERLFLDTALHKNEGEIKNHNIPISSIERTSIDLQKAADDNTYLARKLTEAFNLVEDIEPNKLQDPLRKVQEEKPSLQEAVIYYGVIGDPEFANEVWDGRKSVLILTEDSSNDLLETTTKTGYYNDWIVDFEGCQIVLHQLNEINGAAIPVSYLIWSENQVLF